MPDTVTVKLDRETVERSIRRIEAELEDLAHDEESFAPNAGARLFAERDTLRTALDAPERDDIVYVARTGTELGSDRPNFAVTDRIGAESKHGQIVGYKPYAPLDVQEFPHQPLQPIDDKVEAFRKRFFDITGDRLQRTAVVEGLRAALGGEALEPVREGPKLPTRSPPPLTASPGALERLDGKQQPETTSGGER